MQSCNIWICCFCFFYWTINTASNILYDCLRPNASQVFFYFCFASVSITHMQRCAHMNSSANTEPALG